MDDGKTYKEISDFLGCGYRTVAYWCVHGDPDNLESLRDGREKGNYQKVTKEYIDLLMETIEKDPTELGYEFGRWSTARLATYLTEMTGIELSPVAQEGSPDLRSHCGAVNPALQEGFPT